MAVGLSSEAQRTGFQFALVLDTICFFCRAKKGSCVGWTPKVAKIRSSFHPLHGKLFVRVFGVINGSGGVEFSLPLSWPPGAKERPCDGTRMRHRYVRISSCCPDLKSRCVPRRKSWAAV